MNQLVISTAAFVFGTLIGSFLNVVIWRLPREQSLGGRSHCPHCGQVLKPKNLIPIFSYLGQRGKCAHCHKAISPRYLIIELTTGLLFGLITWQWAVVGMPLARWLELARMLFIVAVLVVVFVIDLEHYLILDVVVFPASIAVLVLNIVVDLLAHQPLWSLASHTGGGLVAALLASGLFYLLWAVSRGRWMGFGDVKFNVLLGLALGWPGIVVGLFLAFMSGAIVGLGLIAAGAKQLQSRVPFGTFLSFGALLALLYATVLVNWYLSLIGI